ncbi:MAG: hypothetical protein QXX79_02885 [Candidatus Bathyarchaeia archaeon]
MIGIDLDTKNEFMLLKTVLNARRLGRVSVTETHRGYHIRIHRNLPLEKAMEVRRALGDCPERLAFDEMKIKLGLYDMVDTLFEAKASWDGVWRKEEPKEPFRLPFWLRRFGKYPSSFKLNAKGALNESADTKRNNGQRVEKEKTKAESV